MLGKKNGGFDIEELFENHPEEKKLFENNPRAEAILLRVLENKERGVLRRDLELFSLTLWFRCPNCAGESIAPDMKYCPDCGFKIVD